MAAKKEIESLPATSCWHCKIDTKNDPKTINILYKLDGKETTAYICQSNNCMLQFQRWIYHHKHCICEACKGYITGLGCLKCANRIGQNAKWEINSFIDNDKKPTLQLFCSIKCRDSASAAAICGVCGNTKSDIICGQCKIVRYCSQECEKKDAERHKQFCQTITMRFYCTNCKKKSQTELSHCARCHKVYYCSPACQREHWKKGHKKECKMA